MSAHTPGQRPILPLLTLEPDRERQTVSIGADHAALVARMGCATYEVDLALGQEIVTACRAFLPLMEACRAAAVAMDAAAEQLADDESCEGSQEMAERLAEQAQGVRSILARAEGREP